MASANTSNKYSDLGLPVNVPLGGDDVASILRASLNLKALKPIPRAQLLGSSCDIRESRSRTSESVHSNVNAVMPHGELIGLIPTTKSHGLIWRSTRKKSNTKAGNDQKAGHCINPTHRSCEWSSDGGVN